MYLTVDFGTTSATVGYTLKNAAGGDAQARTTVGVIDLGDGMYGVEVDIPPTAVGVKWDTGGGSPIFAHEDLIAEQNNIFLRNRNETVKGTGDNNVYRDDNATVYMTTNVYEDSIGLTLYNGNGIERRNRMT